MKTLNFNNIEWEPLDTIVAKRYTLFLEKNKHEAKEFFYLGETQEEIKAEIDKIVFMLGQEPTNDLNKLHEYFADNETDPELSRLNHLIHYECLNLKLKCSFLMALHYLVQKNQ